MYKIHTSRQLHRTNIRKLQTLGINLVMQRDEKSFQTRKLMKIRFYTGTGCITKIAYIMRLNKNQDGSFTK